MPIFQMIDGYIVIAVGQFWRQSDLKKIIFNHLYFTFDYFSCLHFLFVNHIMPTFQMMDGYIVIAVGTTFHVGQEHWQEPRL